MIRTRAQGISKLNDTIRRSARRVVPGRFGAYQRALSLVGLQTVVFNTPRDTGDHASGWTVGVNAEPAYNSAIETAGGTVSRGTSVIEASPAFSKITIGNNRPAIEVLERGLFEPANPGPSKDRRPGRKGRVLVSGGYSVQAPQGMLIAALEAMRAANGRIVRDIARIPARRFGGR